MENSTVEIKIDAAQAEATLDRVIAKAEYLTKMLGDINNIDDEVEMAEHVLTQQRGSNGLPQIVYSINLGDLKGLMAAPADAFSSAFLDKVGKDFRAIANTAPNSPIQPKKEAKNIDLTNSGNYKKPTAEA